jgi:hypothetical protein
MNSRPGPTEKPARPATPLATTAKHFAKQRYAWQVDAWRLLREGKCAEYARKSTPAAVDGVLIEFPETKIKLGARITVNTGALKGRSLFAMLYDQEQREVTVPFGLVALAAWQQAKIKGYPFPIFSLIYRLTKGPRVLLLARRGPLTMTKAQSKEFRRLLASYVRTRDDGRVLVHGDMHASHLLVDRSRPSLGFIDLEAVHTGKPATNFAQLWIAYHHAEVHLGQTFYREFAARFPTVMTAQFDNDVRMELAIRCFSHVREGVRRRFQKLETKARAMFAAVLNGESFEATCLSGRPH